MANELRQEIGGGTLAGGREDSGRIKEIQESDREVDINYQVAEFRTE